MRERILFRADASHALGFGHVARIAALVEECASRDLEPVAMFGGDTDALRAWPGTRHLMVALGSWSTGHVARAAEDPRVRAVVVDGPQLAAALVPALPSTTRAILVDDAGDCPLPAWAVVNHNLHAPELAAGYPHARTCLLGRRYLLLRGDIRRRGRGACPVTPAPGERLRVAVTFGGSDPAGATARVVANLPPAPLLEVVVVCGPGFTDELPLRAAASVAAAAGHVVELHRAPIDPGALFASCHAAVCAAGGTLGELAYLGCPALAYPIVRDQLAPAAAQLALGLIAGGRPWPELSELELRSDLLYFLGDERGRIEQRARALETADGDGPRRILDEALA